MVGASWSTSSLGMLVWLASRARNRKPPSEWAQAQIREAAAEGRLAWLTWDDDGTECVRSFPADHEASLAHFRSPAQHPGALTRRQWLAIRRVAGKVRPV